MKYYKDTENKPWAYEDDADQKYVKEDLTMVSKEEFDELVYEINHPVLPYEELLAIAKANRKAAYVAEADPLFFKMQRGEATQEEWLAKIAEIKSRYPEGQA